MAIKDYNVIKQIIRSNFDRSSLLYEEFEQKYGLFKDLTHQLAGVCNIRKGMTVIDIGCGTGTSTFTLAKLVGAGGRVIAIDFSEEMLSSAQEKLNRKTGTNSDTFSNIEFRLCDAELLNENIDPGVDVVMYNACIFLIPNSNRTLNAACAILKEDGIVGMNYLIGIFGEIKDRTIPGPGTPDLPPHDEPEYSKSMLDKVEGDRVDLFRSAKQDNLDFAPYGRKIVETGILTDLLRKVGFRKVRQGAVSIKMTGEEVKDFYSIPAQSAGLYPKTPYEERLKLLDGLLDHFRDSGIMRFYQRWGWCTGVK